MLRRASTLHSRDRRWLAPAFFLWGFGVGLWYHSQPLYLAELGAEPTQIGLALSIAGLSVIFLYVPAGYVTDRGPKKWSLFPGFVTGTPATTGLLRLTLPRVIKQV